MIPVEKEQRLVIHKLICEEEAILQQILTDNFLFLHICGECDTDIES